jgi:hypothetical protein
MPWTEHPTNPEAREIRERQSTLAQRLCLAIKGLALDADEAQYRTAFAENNLSNAEAMLTLHEGFKGVKRRRFLPYVQRKKNTFEPTCLPGVEVNVLGPSRDPDVIRDMTPPDAASYLRLMEDAAFAGSAAANPFPAMPGWEREAFLNLLKNINCEHMLDSFTPDFADGISKEGGIDDMALAIRLENAVNGTSLMMMFRFGSAYLLFPGDAQWGTWQLVLADPVWRALLAKTTFYKVGHHGSHNATPVEFVEKLLPEGALAMVPTRLMKRWPYIPKLELLKGLDDRRVTYARSDIASNTTPHFQCEERDGKPFWFEAQIPVSGA